MAASLVVLVALAACAETSPPPVATSDPVADSADYVMFGVRHQLTDQGVRKAQLQSDTALLFDDGQRMLLRDVRLIFFTEQGVQNAVLTSRRGRYDTRSQDMEATGNVIVTTTDGRRMETEQLRFDQGQNLISSDSAYVVTEGGRRQSGTGFRSDPSMRNVQCLSSCSGVLGAVALPTEDASSATPAPRDTGGALRPGSRPGSVRLP